MNFDQSMQIGQRVAESEFAVPIRWSANVSRAAAMSWRIEIFYLPVAAGPAWDDIVAPARQYP